MKSKRAAAPNEELALSLKELYERVAVELGIDPSYVSRAARGELRSHAVEAELERQLKGIRASARSRERSLSRNGNKAGRHASNTI